uniref:Uncharacterized protein n=1 Tax=Arundo donax TaxID=35708 RepID=A0A0A8XRX7_ARUDO
MVKCCVFSDGVTLSSTLYVLTKCIYVFIQGTGPSIGVSHLENNNGCNGIKGDNVGGKEIDMDGNESGTKMMIWAVKRSTVGIGSHVTLNLSLWLTLVPISDLS